MKMKREYRKVKNGITLISVMGLNILLLDQLRTLIALSMLSYAAYKDLKTREVHDRVWVIGAALGFILSIYEVFFGTLSYIQIIISAGFMLGLGGVLGYLKLFGEADILAFITLSIIHPKAPVFLSYIWGWTPPLFSFTMLSNSALAGLLPVFYIIIRNLSAKNAGVELFERHPGLSLIQRISLILTGVYQDMNKAKGPPFQYPLENLMDDTISLRPDIWDDEKAREVFAGFKEKGVERLWVSETLPYIVVILVGYVLSVTVSDILLQILMFWL